MANEKAGGKNTTKSEKEFTKDNNIEKLLEENGYEFEDTEFRTETYVVRKITNTDDDVFVFKETALESFMKSLDPEYNLYDYVSKKIRPDNVVINSTKMVAKVFEYKNQNGNGSVDEKLETVDFKKKKYIKIFGPFGYKVELIYIISDFFQRDSKYQDVLTYMFESGCHVFFPNEITVDEIMDGKINKVNKRDIKKENNNASI